MGPERHPSADFRAHIGSRRTDSDANVQETEGARGRTFQWPSIGQQDAYAEPFFFVMQETDRRRARHVGSQRQQDCKTGSPWMRESLFASWAHQDKLMRHRGQSETPQKHQLKAGRSVSAGTVRPDDVMKLSRGPRRGQSKGISVMGLRFLGELVADRIWHPPGPGCDRFRLESCDEKSGLSSHQ